MALSCGNTRLARAVPRDHPRSCLSRGWASSCAAPSLFRDLERCEALVDDHAGTTVAHQPTDDSRRGRCDPTGAVVVRRQDGAGDDRIMLIDHLMYRAPDLADAVADVEERFGVRAHAGGRHIGLGTHNALLALGPRTYLEIIAPDPGQPQPSVPRPFGLDGVNRGGLAGWAIACQDIDAAVADARRCGYDPGEVAEMQRAGPTGMVLRWRLTVNVVPGGLVPFLISWGDTDTLPDQHRAGSPWSFSTRAPRSRVPRAAPWCSWR